MGYHVSSSGEETKKRSQGVYFYVGQTCRYVCVFIVVALSASYILSFRVHFCAELEIPILLKMSASLMSWLLTPVLVC